MDKPLPDKLYFKIGEVSALIGVEPYTLRFWESEFSEIKPSKTQKGHRMYRKKDVECLMKIRELLYDDGLTIAGAKRKLRGSEEQSGARDEMLRKLRKDLLEVEGILDEMLAFAGNPS